MDYMANLILAAVRITSPLIFLSLAELYSQRAGLVNIGIEGIVALGSLVGFLVSVTTGSPLLGVLAGALAGLMTKTGTIAFIGGMELDTTKDKYAGYGEAAAFVAGKNGRSVTLLDPVYSGDFSASDKGLEFAKAMMDQGADVFFGDASAVDSGAWQAIDAANDAAGEIKIYNIAQPADLLGQNACIIGSQVTDNSVLIELSMKAVEAGTFGGETLYGTLQNGVLSAGKLNAETVPEDVQTAYAGYIQQMTDGTFMSD